MYDPKPFVSFGVAPNAAVLLAQKMSRKHGLSGPTVEAKAREIVETHAPQMARLILTWRKDGRLYCRDCQGRFSELKAALTPEYLDGLKARCDTWADKNGGTTEEIWISANGPVLCWRNAEAGWMWLR